MKNRLFALGILLSLAMVCLSSANGQEAENQMAVDYVTHTGSKVDFGKTDPSAYTPEIRANMKQLYQDKIGLFVHFGPYAQLEGVWDGRRVAAEWIMNRGRIPIKEYEKHAAGLFKPEKFNAGEWVDIAESAGMKFIVVTAKHHDGFAMYDSKHPYNLINFAGFGRDILKELSVECAKRDMNLGFYYSQSQDWHEEGGFGNGWDFPNRIKPQDKFDAYFEEKAVMQVKELTSHYGDIFMIWFDTPVQMDDAKCQQMMDIVKANQPAALVNSRLGQGFGHFDVSIDNGKTPSVSKATWLPDLKVPWQTHESVTQGGWGYTRSGGEKDRSSEYTDFVYSLCRIVCYGGVYLLNVGPRPDGTIPESQVNSIRAIGKWLEVNGEAIYGADPSPLKFPPFAITSKPGKLYLHLKDLDQEQVELTGILSGVTKAYCLADSKKESLKVDQNGADLRVTIPEKLRQPRITVVVLKIAADTAKVVDETLQQEPDGVIKLPVAKCEFAIRRISYDYEQQVTHRWGENAKQGLIWTVNVTKPGQFSVTTEDTGNDRFVYKLITANDTLLLNSKGRSRQPQRREHEETIQIDQAGVQKIAVYPKDTVGMRGGLRFKGLELIPVEQAALGQGTAEHYPAFSWEVTPQYFMFGDTQRVLLPEEVRSIAARTDFLCIEKSHGLQMLGAAELGAKHEAAEFKKIKPGMKVLFYFNSAYAYPFTSYSKGLTPGKIDQHPELKKFLLVDPETGKLAHRRNVFFFDVLNPDLREWWVNTVAKGVTDSGCDGAFLDQMHGFAWLRQDKSEEVEKAMGDMMASLKKKMEPDKILLGNNANQAIAKHVFPAIDASMFEHYNEKLLSKESLLQDWADMLRIAQAGKISIFRIGVESDRSTSTPQNRRGARRDRSERMSALAKERLEYYLACYLIGAQPYSYFQYGWGWTLSSGSLQDYPELHKPLGAPKGAYQRTTPEGWEFTREFEHASVWVDTEKGQAKISWR